MIKLTSDVARLAFLVSAAFAACTAWAAQPELEPGNWKLHVVSTTNGKPEPVQNTEECLGDELKDFVYEMLRQEQTTDVLAYAVNSS